MPKKASSGSNGGTFTRPWARSHGQGLYLLGVNVVSFPGGFRVNKQHNVVSLQWGTRQGCLFSPLLLIIMIEPMAIWRKSEQDFEGTTCSDTIKRVLLYANDLLLYRTNRVSLLPVHFHIMEQFDTLQKNVLLSISSLAEYLLGLTTDFAIRIFLSQELIPVCLCKLVTHGWEFWDFIKLD